MSLKNQKRKGTSNSMNVLRVGLFIGIIIILICLSKYGVFKKSNDSASAVNILSNNESKLLVDTKDHSSAAYKNLCQPIENKPQGYGVSPGNAAGGLRIAEMENGWIYYAIENRIYKVKNNDDRKQLVYEGDKRVFDVNVTGQWVYFTLAGGDLCRIKTDGKEFERLKEEGLLAVNTMTVAGDNIYFVDNNLKMYKMNINDKKLVKLYYNKVQYQVADNDIYINGGHAEGCKIFKMDIEGRNKKTLVEEPVLTLCAYDEWIYYVSNGTDKKIYKVKKDGTNKSLVYACDDKVDMINNINVTKDYIFFTVNKGVDVSQCGPKDKLYKMKKDGTEVTFICDDVSRLSGISVAGSWIYYKEYANDILCRVSLDGKINEKLEEITKH